MNGGGGISVGHAYGMTGAGLGSGTASNMSSSPCAPAAGWASQGYSSSLSCRGDCRAMTGQRRKGRSRAEIRPAIYKNYLPLDEFSFG